MRRDAAAHGFTSSKGEPLPAAATDDVPPASDASRIHWGNLHDTWRAAADACRGRPPGKEPLPDGVLIAIAAHRVRAVPLLRQALDRDRKLRQCIGSLQRHARDAQGRNWDIAALGCDRAPVAVFELELRRIVDAMRDQFDLA